MRIICGDRATGKSDVLLGWLLDDPDHRVIMAVNERMAENLVGQGRRKAAKRRDHVYANAPESWWQKRVVTVNRPDHWQRASNIEVAIDNLDLLLSYITRSQRPLICTSSDYVQVEVITSADKRWQD